MEFLAEIYQDRGGDDDMSSGELDDLLSPPMPGGSMDSLEKLFQEESGPDMPDLPDPPQTVRPPKTVVHYVMVCVDRKLEARRGKPGDITDTMRQVFAERPGDTEGKETEVVNRETTGRNYARFDVWMESIEAPATLLPKTATVALGAAARREYRIAPHDEYSFAFGIAAEQTVEGEKGSRVETAGNMDLYPIMRHALRTDPSYFYVPATCLDRALRPLTTRESLYWHMSGARRAKEANLDTFKRFYEEEMAGCVPAVSTVYRRAVVMLDRTLTAVLQEEKLERDLRDLNGK